MSLLEEGGESMRSKRKGDVLSLKKDNGSVLLLDTADVRIYKLNPVAARIWELCDRYCTIDDVADQLHKEYAVSFRRAKKDVQEFLQILGKRGIIKNGSREISFSSRRSLE